MATETNETSYQNESDVLALFDFDGTLITKDSLMKFISYTEKPLKYYFGFLILAPTIIGYKLGIINNQDAKEKVMEHFYKGWSVERFTARGKKFAKDRIPKMLNKEAYAKLNWHKEKGHTVYVVTASPNVWVKPWTDKEEIGLISSELNFKKYKFSGKLDGANNYGEEKVKRIKEKLDLTKFKKIYAYGDSKGDMPMIELADEKFFRTF